MCCVCVCCVYVCVWVHCWVLLKHSLKILLAQQMVKSHAAAVVGKAYTAADVIAHTHVHVHVHVAAAMVCVGPRGVCACMWSCMCTCVLGMNVLPCINKIYSTNNFQYFSFNVHNVQCIHVHVFLQREAVQPLKSSWI